MSIDILRLRNCTVWIILLSCHASVLDALLSWSVCLILNMLTNGKHYLVCPVYLNPSSFVLPCENALPVTVFACFTLFAPSYCECSHMLFSFGCPWPPQLLIFYLPWLCCANGITFLKCFGYFYVAAGHFFVLCNALTLCGCRSCLVHDVLLAIGFSVPVYALKRDEGARAKQGCTWS